MQSGLSRLGCQCICRKELRQGLHTASALRRRAGHAVLSTADYGRMYGKLEKTFTREMRKRFGFVYGDVAETSQFRVPERLGPSFYRGLDPKKRRQLSELFLTALRDVVREGDFAPADRELLSSVEIVSANVDQGVQNLKISWTPSGPAAHSLRAERRLEELAPELRKQLRDRQTLGFIPRVMMYRDLSAGSLDVLNRKFWEADYPDDYRPSTTMVPEALVSETVFEVEVLSRYTGEEAAAKEPESTPATTVDSSTSSSSSSSPPKRRPSRVLGLDRDSLAQRLRTAAAAPRSLTERAEWERRAEKIIHEDKRRPKAARDGDL